MLVGHLRYHWLLPCIRSAENDLVRIADLRLAVGVPFGAAAAALVDDDNRLIGELVFGDDALHRARNVVGSTARTGGGNELDRL